MSLVCSSTGDCDGVAGGVGSAFIDLGRQEGFGGMAATAVHDIFGDIGGVISAACSAASSWEDVGVAGGLEDACFEAGVEGACSAAGSEGDGVCGAAGEGVNAGVAAGVDATARAAGLGASAGLGFFACRSRMC